MVALDARAYWYLRHGETDWNAQGLSQGRSDIPLNATGTAQAHAAGNILAAHWHDYQPITRIIASPLVRARRTAEITADSIASNGGPSLEIRLSEDLQEVCFGVQEGEPMGNWYDDWIAGDYTPEGAEPFAVLRDRVVRAVNDATNAEGAALIVAHGAVFRALRSAMGLEPNVRLPNAAPLWLEPDDGDQWTLTRVGAS